MFELALSAIKHYSNVLPLKSLFIVAHFFYLTPSKNETETREVENTFTVFTSRAG